MVTTTGSPNRNFTGSPINISNGSTKSSNPAKESFLLLDLLQEVKNVGIALVEFKTNHGKDVSEGGIKNLEVMVESLEFIYSAGTSQIGKVSLVKYLTRAYGLMRNTAKKRKSEDPMQIVRAGAMHGLRKFVRMSKKARKKVVEKENAPPKPMPFYEEPQ